MTSIRTPCQRWNRFVMIAGTAAMSETRMATGKSRYMFCAETGSLPPYMKEQTARIGVVSMTFAPITLPTDIEVCFLTTAVIAVASSGSDVPIATIVTPMIASETPHDAAMSLPLLTRSCEPMTMHAAPTTTRSIFSTTVFLSVEGRSSVFSAGSLLAERMFSKM